MTYEPLPIGAQRDDPGVSGAAPPSEGVGEASPTTNSAFDFTITLAGGDVAFDTAEIVSLSQRFDLATLKRVTDVEIRLSRRPVSPPLDLSTIPPDDLPSPPAGEGPGVRGEAPEAAAAATPDKPS